jgi:hypothetical protein
MNLSTDKAVDILIEITPYVADIINDSDLRKVIDKYKKTPAKQIQYFAELIPMFLKKHREPVYIILAALNETTVEEIQSQPFAVTVKQIKEIASDKELISFFTSLAKAE